MSDRLEDMYARLPTDATGAAGGVLAFLGRRRTGTVGKGSTIMALKRGPNSLKSGPNSLKRGQCYIIFGQNEAVFRRNLHANNGLPLWWIPTINKPNPSKDLQPIMVDIPPIDFRKPLSGFEMRREQKPEKVVAYYNV
jgi:hypothetical protein